MAEPPELFCPHWRRWMFCKSPPMPGLPWISQICSNCPSVDDPEVLYNSYRPACSLLQGAFPWFFHIHGSKQNHEPYQHIAASYIVVLSVIGMEVVKFSIFLVLRKMYSPFITMFSGGRTIHVVSAAATCSLPFLNKVFSPLVPPSWSGKWHHW